MLSNCKTSCYVQSDDGFISLLEWCCLKANYQLSNGPMPKKVLLLSSWCEFRPTKKTQLKSNKRKINKHTHRQRLKKRYTMKTIVVQNERKKEEVEKKTFFLVCSTTYSIYLDDPKDLLNCLCVRCCCCCFFSYSK